MNLNELDFEDYGSWPDSVKVLAATLVLAVLVFLGVWFHVMSQKEDLDILQQEMQDLKKEFETNQKKVLNLEEYKLQMVKMKESLNELLLLLPEENEVPGLVEDISQQGLAAGLSFKQLRIMPENRVDFYIELPIEIEVVGGFHELAMFVSNVAGLSRIVTLHDFDVRPYVYENNTPDLFYDPLLVMRITAKTYRYDASGGVFDEK